MSLRRAAAAAVLITALAGAGALAPPGSATAAEPAGSDRAAPAGCVSKAEFRTIKVGMTVPQVKRLTGTNGRQVPKSELSEGTFVIGRAYQACAPREAVGVSFTNEKGRTYRVAAKSASGQGR